MRGQQSVLVRAEVGQPEPGLLDKQHEPGRRVIETDGQGGDQIFERYYAEPRISKVSCWVYIWRALLCMIKLQGNLSPNVTSLFCGSCLSGLLCLAMRSIMLPSSARSAG